MCDKTKGASKSYTFVNHKGHKNLGLGAYDPCAMPEELHAWENICELPREDTPGNNAKGKR